MQTVYTSDRGKVYNITRFSNWINKLLSFISTSFMSMSIFIIDIIILIFQRYLHRNQHFVRKNNVVTSVRFQNQPRSHYPTISLLISFNSRNFQSLILPGWFYYIKTTISSIILLNIINQYYFLYCNHLNAKLTGPRHSIINKMVPFS